MKQRDGLRGGGTGRDRYGEIASFDYLIVGFAVNALARQLKFGRNVVKNKATKDVRDAITKLLEYAASQMQGWLISVAVEDT